MTTIWVLFLLLLVLLCIIKLISFVGIYITRPKQHLKNEQRSKDAAAKKRPNTSGVGKMNNYYEDIYISPYNNTD